MRYLLSLIRRFTRRPYASPEDCTLHDVIERGVYRYRCARCGECFVCGHTQIDYTYWVCRDGTHIQSTPSPGIRAESTPKTKQ